MQGLFYVELISFKQVAQEIVEGEGFDVRKPDEQNITILHWAAINNRKDLVTYYLSAGSIIDAIGGDLNSTPLHWAVRQGHQSWDSADFKIQSLIRNHPN